MTAYRRYRALYNFDARGTAELSMKLDETLTVTQLADGSWPPAEKWMQGYNEVTSQTGEFPGGAYVEFMEEFVIEPDPPPPEVEPRSQAPPPLPPQPSPRHNSHPGFQLPEAPRIGVAKPVSRGYGSQPEIDATGYRDNSPRVAPDDSEETPPPPPPRNILRKGSDSQSSSRGSLPAPPPKPQPRTKRVSTGSNSRETGTPIHNSLKEEEGGHRWVSMNFGLPVQCAGCKLSMGIPVVSLEAVHALLLQRDGSHHEASY